VQRLKRWAVGGGWWLIGGAGNPEGKRANFHVTTEGNPRVDLCMYLLAIPSDISESKVAKGNMKNALNLVTRGGVGGRLGSEVRSQMCVCVHANDILRELSLGPHMCEWAK